MQRQARPARRLRRILISATALTVGALSAPSGTQDAVANGDTRTLRFHHVHTKETASVTYRRNGSYDSAALAQLNWLLRDWRSDEQTKMDPRLFDIIWEVQRSVGSTEPVHINSAYRSPGTNSMLRRRSRAVSKHSQHMNGRAMDFYLPDVEMARVRAAAIRLQAGGVGFYPSSHNSFVHLDSGSVRAWPRMTRDQLVRLFPDGKTVHLPADGQPLAGYEEARAEILARGGAVAGVGSYAEAEDGASTGRRRSFWATLFGGDEDEDAEFYRAPRQTARVGRGGGDRQPSTAVAAYAPAAGGGGDDAGARSFFVATAPVPEAPRAGRASPRATISPRASEPPPEPATQVASLAPAATSGPRYLWDRGPNGAPAPREAAGAEATAEIDPRAAAERATVAAVPLPPRRPDEGLTTVAADVPLPPTRPVALAALGDVALPAIVGPRNAPAAPGPGRAGSPEAVVVAALASNPLPSAAREPSDSFIKEVARVDEGRAQLRALFAAVASDAAVPARGAVATARTRPQPASAAANGLVADAGSALRLGFSTASEGELTSARFTGPAVRPLPVLR